jgi:hypothetical protein
VSTGSIVQLHQKLGRTFQRHSATCDIHHLVFEAGKLRFHRLVVDVSVAAGHLRRFVAQVFLDDMLGDAKIRHFSAHAMAEAMRLKPPQMAGTIDDVALNGKLVQGA